MPATFIVDTGTTTTMTSTTRAIPADQLAQLYAQARYFVRIGPQQLQFQIGQPAPDLERHLAAACYLYITAWNPHSQPKNEHQNTTADQALQQHLLNADLTFHPAWSSDADGTEVEHGWLVLDIPQFEADKLARAFGQAGIVYWDAGQPLQLRMQLAQPQHWAGDANIQWIG